MFLHIKIELYRYVISDDLYDIDIWLTSGLATSKEDNTSIKWHSFHKTIKIRKGRDLTQSCDKHT